VSEDEIERSKVTVASQMDFDTFQFAQKNYNSIKNYASFLPIAEHTPYDQAKMEQSRVHSYCNLTTNETVRRDSVKKCLALLGISNPNPLQLPATSTFITEDVVKTHAQALCQLAKISADNRGSRKRKDRGAEKEEWQKAATWISKELKALYGTRLRPGQRNTIKGYFYEAHDNIAKLAEIGVFAHDILKENKNWKPLKKHKKKSGEEQKK